jgi:hypothetical protein
MGTAKIGAPQGQAEFRVGDRVQFGRGLDLVEGVIVEDRGAIGVGGRRLYRIEFRLSPDYESAVELPAEEFERAPPAEK